MRAIRFHEHGGPEVLRLDEIEKPQPGAGEVLIRTVVAGINYADTMLRRGNYLMKPPLPFTPGFEAAGTIEALGAGVEDLHIGQRVMATVQAAVTPNTWRARPRRSSPFPTNWSSAGRRPCSCRD